MTTIAFLGLGRMGAAMAAALCAASHDVTVWNRSSAGYPRLDDELQLAGADRTPRRARTPAEAVVNAQAVLTMLADGPAIDDVLFGRDGAAASLRTGTVVCDLSTTGVDSARHCAARLNEAGIDFVDAPVSGSVPTVRARRLLVMAGGKAESVSGLESILAAFAARVVHVGGSGSGQAMKLSVNAVVHILDGAISEALVLAERGGVSRDMALEVFSASVVGAPFVQYKRPAFADPDGHPVAFTIDLMRKDLGLVVEFARDRGSPVPLAAAAARVTDAAVAAGLGDRDMSALAILHRAAAAPDEQTDRQVL
jgi:3-hydroxyisobutyrate dehydrogenase-like beta-hydroxyacid dehydrogenase